MISQTAHFPGLTPERLYIDFLPAEDHAAMTADGRQQVSYQRPEATAIIVRFRQATPMAASPAWAAAALP